MEPERIGNFIKNLRQEYHLTQKEFADRLGVTYQAVSKWETGKSIPDILLLKEICKIYDIDMNELLNGEKKQEDFHSRSKKNKLWIVILIMILLVGIIIFIIYHYPSHHFEFKKITTTCDEFTITGSAAYNVDKTSIYISNVEYCGETDSIIYEKIECSLYEDYKDTKRKIGSCGMVDEKMTLQSFLDTVEMNVNNYVASCKMFTSSSLFLEILAMDEENKITTYLIPISLEENCKDS